MIEVFNETSKRLVKSLMFYSEMADYFDFLSLHGLKRVMEYYYMKTSCERRGVHRYSLNHLNKLIKESEVQSEKIIPDSWYSHVRNDVDRPTRKEYLVLAMQKWISNESEMKQFLEKQFKTLTDNSKIAEADKINEIILCVDNRLKLANRKMLEYKAVDYDSYYIIYDQKELHEKYESMEKDGFRIEMC